ncbi:hypothetical protein THOM_2874, partial [Trachipleistophora hominis]
VYMNVSFVLDMCTRQTTKFALRSELMVEDLFNQLLDIDTCKRKQTKVTRTNFTG